MSTCAWLRLRSTALTYRGDVLVLTSENVKLQHAKVSRITGCCCACGGCWSNVMSTDAQRTSPLIAAMCEPARRVCACMRERRPLQH